MPPYAYPEDSIAVPRMLSRNSPPATSPAPHLADDDHLAAMYICMRSLASGRWLRDDVPPQQLSEEELIAFWADDLESPSGRRPVSSD
jgi:hypothetical protein